jgi:1-acyl-sn-glycerol-3-phosphate acyltransferase
VTDGYGVWARRLLWARSVVFQVLLVLSVLVFAVPVLATLLVPGGSGRWRFAYAVARAWSGVVLWLLRLVCGISYEVHGRPWLPDRPTVVLMKHQSAWETIAQFRLFPPQCWVLKKELMRVPVFGWCLRALQPIPVDRKRGKAALQAVVDVGKKRLEDGLWVVVFPEGTRVRPGEANRYRPGGAVLAATTGVPVLPVAVNSGSFWPTGSLMKYPGTITVSIGPPVDSAGREADAILRDAHDWIEREQRLLDPVPARAAMADAAT